MKRLELTMPKMSMTMEEGTMVVWLKQPGDEVRSGEPVAEVTTDKVDMEVESPYDGRLAEHLAQPDDVVAVGAPIGIIESESDDLLGGLFDGEPGSETETPAEPESTPEARTSADTSPSSSDAAPDDWPAAVPAARKLANERGIDLASVQGTGAWGARRLADVEATAQSASSAPSTASVSPAAPGQKSGDVQSAFGEVESALQRLAALVHVEPTDTASAHPAAQPDPAAAAIAEAAPKRRKPANRRERLRQQVAKAMEASAGVPQFTAWRDLDLGAIDRVRKTELGGASWTAVLVRAQALALASVPALLGRWAADGGVDPDDGIGVALAIDAPDGLVAPVVRDPHQRSLADVATDVVGLVSKARESSLKPNDLAGGTTVFSNLGGLGVRQFNALITPPHATALSAGSVERRVVAADDGSFGVRLVCTVGLTVDHRVADGADAARALQELADIVADPTRLL
ncbi:MAG TPA: 2-oxo acid dehydrogenase subunit E2 [Candidatus Agrococcus pullicola]|uniref:Dihydrolipoamide acetyltransferase component of pyruvate dehydrogenase complex n=1 Tax=Candidatus Agrococcus pullicola TaxID=2838429 RepID=A0A9D2CA74_9MICO|nr:2-oxo acid dehydrogenase subunit E2 [Candidatus Agrococcus pullicola]